MASSAEGGAVFLLVGVAVVVCASSAVLHRFAERDVGALPLLISVLGFTLSFGIVGLVAYDVGEALALSGHEAVDPDVGPGRDQLEVVRQAWSAVYWTTTVLCYLVIPVLIEFEAAGEFSVAARLRASLRRNVAWYIAYAALGLVAVVWLVWHQLEIKNLGAWCIAASNTWGLVLLTVLMGFGLVSVPRELWSHGNPTEELHRLYPLATARDEASKSARYELQELIAQAEAEMEGRGNVEAEEATEGSSSDSCSVKRAFAVLQRTLEKCQLLQQQLATGCSLRRSAGAGAAGNGHHPAAPLWRTPPAPVRRTPSQRSLPLTSGPGDVVKRLEQLHKNLKHAELEARRAACRWDDLVQHCLWYEDLVNEHFTESWAALEEGGGDSARSVYGGGFGAAFMKRFFCRCHAARALGDWLLALWFRTWRGRVFRACSYLCGVFSVVIVLGQLTILNKGGFTLSLLSLFFHQDHGVALTQALCILPLGYMACTAYWSVFRLKIAGWYGLYGDHNTDACSLLWCSYALARLAMPLCYHFLLQIDVPPHLHTSFQDFMGQVEPVPVLGHPMNQVYPLLVALLCFCNMLNIYSPVVRCLGLYVLEFDFLPAADSEDPVGEGRELIARERRRRAESSLEEDHADHRDVGGPSATEVPGGP